MSTALCKNRYFTDLIKKRQVCIGMTKEMVLSSWGAPWRKIPSYENRAFVETWEWGTKAHSRVKFNAEGKVTELSSVAHGNMSKPWRRA